MPDLTPNALAILRTQHGHATTSQLNNAGVHRRARQRLIETQVLTSVYKSVVRIGSAPNTMEGRCAAVCLGHPSGFITGPTGGKLLGLWRMPRPEPMHLAVPHGIHLERHHNLILHQTTSIKPSDVRRREDGIVTASPSRLAFDLAAILSIQDHASVIEQLLREGHCSMAELGSVARRLCHPRRPGSLRFVRTLMARGDRPAAESHPEIVLGDALRSEGSPSRTPGEGSAASERRQDPHRSGGTRGTLGNRDRHPSGSTFSSRAPLATSGAIVSAISSAGRSSASLRSTSWTLRVSWTNSSSSTKYASRPHPEAHPSVCDHPGCAQTLVRA